MCVITTEKYVEQMDGQSNFDSIVQCYTEFLQYMIETLKSIMFYEWGFQIICVFIKKYFF